MREMLTNAATSGLLGVHEVLEDRRPTGEHVDGRGGGGVPHHEAALAGAPAAEDGRFRVPQILGEEQ